MSNPELLKVQLKIKRQLKYLEKCYKDSLVKYPDNKMVRDSWFDMITATRICLEIANGEEE